MSDKVKLADIASGIAVHLKRFEEDPEISHIKGGIGSRITCYWRTSCCSSGRWVYVSYVAYQGNSNLTREEAVTYLNWLDAGHVGRHYEALSAATKEDRNDK